MKQALVISFSNLKTDARVKRQIGFLKNLGFIVTAACYGTQDSELNFVKLSAPKLNIGHKVVTGTFLFFRFYNKAYQLLYGQQLVLTQKFHLIVANDIEALPLAFQQKGIAKILFDAHEYAPRHFENKPSWRFFFQGFNKFLCQKYIPQVDGMITVGEVIAKEYEKHYKITPRVITNAPAYYNNQYQKTLPEKIRLVHQGIANPSRNLELMFEMMNYLDERFYLDLMLVEPTHRSNILYLQKLKRLALKNDRIQFVPPVSTDTIISTLNHYDIGIILIPPINFNYKNTLPNKFFECIQARIALAIGPIPEIKIITEHYDIGVVSEDFTAKNLASKLLPLTAEKINHFKANTERAAKELNATKNEVLFKDVVESILQR